MAEDSGGKPAFGMRTAEGAAAAGFLTLGAIVIYDSVRLGFGWKEDGPQAGYFPFYIGVIICVSSLVNLAVALYALRAKDKTFVETGQLKLVLSVLVPSAAYLFLIGGAGSFKGLGIYVASALFVAFFMRWLGKYPWWKVAAVSVGNSVVFFLIFEIWFKIPLPKGPLEAFLRLN
jgi:putative tricarboxylic transport membrane protein